MRFKILTYIFSVPLLWLTILLLKLVTPDFGIPRLVSSAVLIGLLIGSLIERFFRNDKYLINVVLEDQKLRFTYLTSLARQHEVAIGLDTITNIKVKKKIFLLRDFTSIKFFGKENEIRFFLLNRKVKERVNQLLQTYPEKLLASKS